VYRLGVLQTAALILFSVGFTVSALPVLTSPAVLGILALSWSFVVLAAWCTSAWRRGRPWAWWTFAVLSGLDVVYGLAELGAGGSSWEAWYSLVIGAGTLILLSHPENRDRRNGPVEPFPVNAPPADPSYYR
jgi:apolipoprotein N-acyltransferase